MFVVIILVRLQERSSIALNMNNNLVGKNRGKMEKGRLRPGQGRVTEESKVMVV